jgi:membrane protein
MFYSSFILYFGASFIREYAALIDDPIIPLHKAYQYELQKIAIAGEERSPC